MRLWKIPSRPRGSARAGVFELPVGLVPRRNCPAHLQELRERKVPTDCRGGDMLPVQRRFVQR